MLVMWRTLDDPPRHLDRHRLALGVDRGGHCTADYTGTIGGTIMLIQSKPKPQYDYTSEQLPQLIADAVRLREQMTEVCTKIAELTGIPRDLAHEHCCGVVERIELLADVEEAPTDGQWLPTFKLYDDIW
jgi:hypothetical protein